jgi:hypothetical protein
MPRATFRRPAVVGAVLVLGLLALGALSRVARADRSPPAAAIRGPAAEAKDAEGEERLPLPRRGESARRSAAGAQGSGSWWLGTAGIALALAVFGAISLATRRYLPQQGSGPLRVVGRTNLSPKHTVYLLQAGERVLIVGAGPQGAPSLLGELTDSTEAEPRPHPRKPTRASAPAPSPDHPASVPVAVPVPVPGSPPLTVRFDRRVGDDE